MIYVKFGRQSTLKKFLTLLFSSNKVYTYLTCVETFSDEECTIRQCAESKYRSIEDLLEIVNTYYPTITIERLCKVLFSLKLNNSGGQTVTIHTLSCDHIDKTTLLFTPYSSINHSTNKRKSKWSGKELFEMSKL